jgi:hypothetical protein
VLYLIWPLAAVTIVVAVWLVRHPVALLTVNVEVATWVTFGEGAAVALALALWIAWVCSVRWS